MSTRWPPRIPSPNGGGGGPPPGSVDHFAPKYLVGNVPAGDSNVAYSTGGFVYIPDPGDGTGVEAALAAASIVPGDVWVRPGTFDVGIGTAALPLAVPAGVLVRGAGNGLTIFVAPSDPAARGDLAVFLVNGEAWDIQVHLPNLTSVNPGGSLALVTVTGTGTTRRMTLNASTITTPDNLGALAVAIIQEPGSLTEDVAIDGFPILGAGGGPFACFLSIVGAAPSNDLTRIVRPHTSGTSAAGVGLTGGAVAISVQHQNVEIIEPWLIDMWLGGIFVEADGDITANVQITDPHIEWRYTDAGTPGRQAIRVKAADFGGIIGVCDSVRVTRGWFDNFAVNGTGSRAIAFIAGGGGGFANVVKNCEVIGATCRNWDEAAHISKTGISVVDANGIVDTDTGGAPIVNVNDLNFRTTGNW